MTVEEVLASHRQPAVTPESDAIDAPWLNLATRLDPALGGGPRPPLPPLTPDEEADFAEYEYKSRLPIAITGEIQRSTSNRVIVGRRDVLLSDALFALFLRLVVELHARKDGAVHMHDLQAGEDAVLPQTNPFMTIGRFRQAFKPVLNGLPPDDFIERWRQKTIRLSTHPQLIRYDRAKLLRHDSAVIRSIAERLSLPPPQQSA